MLQVGRANLFGLATRGPPHVALAIMAARAWPIFSRSRPLPAERLKWT